LTTLPSKENKWPARSTILSSWTFPSRKKRESSEWSEVASKVSKLPPFYRLLYYKTFSVPVEAKTQKIDLWSILELERKAIEIVENCEISEECKVELLWNISEKLISGNYTNEELRYLSVEQVYRLFIANALRIIGKPFGAVQHMPNRYLHRRFCGISENGFNIRMFVTIPFHDVLSRMVDRQGDCTVENYTFRNRNNIVGIISQIAFDFCECGNPHIQGVLKQIGLDKFAEIMQEIERTHATRESLCISEESEESEDIQNGFKFLGSERAACC